MSRLFHREALVVGLHTRVAIVVVSLLAMVGGFSRAASPTRFDQPPGWAREAIWYQVFVERFRNGDPSNDPTPVTMVGAYPGVVPEGWKVTPWGQDWYEPDGWFPRDGDGGSEFHQWVAARRFGGDLQGVLDKLDELQGLGVTALYFNPLNDAPSLHKYDARHYRHIDRNFGPDPAGDAKIIAAEEPINPATWQWTAADRLFLKLIDVIHHRGMRVILDYSWNHTGVTFWAWQDVVKNQAKSRYRDWYDVDEFDNPATPENEFAYHGWLNVKTLPEWKKVNEFEKRPGHAFEGDLHPEVKAHIFNVTRRWLDPNGDGDPSDGVDGFRLDVAHHVPLGFWRDYRRFVRGISPDALLLGEAWWTKWPDELMDPRPFLQGDVFDSVMHYQWYRPARQFFAQANGGMTAAEFVSAMSNVYAGYSPSLSQNLMNLSASHDSPRLVTSFLNRDRAYKFKMGARDNPDLNLGLADEETQRMIRLLGLHQFTFLSAPHLWNGEEFGMWGADDPDCRKPVLWDDISFAPQTYRPDGTQLVVPVVVQTDVDYRDYVKRLIAMRKERRELIDGKLAWTHVGKDSLTLAYSRWSATQETLVVFNRSRQVHEFRLAKRQADPYYVCIETFPDAVIGLAQDLREVRFRLAAMSGAALGAGR